MADITVQVSSAGLNAYGTNAYGVGNYGGNNQPSIQTQSVDAFNVSGWGGQNWGFALWGELNDVTVSLTGLTTLQTSTGDEAATPNQGWGRLAWGSISWGQAFENVTVAVTTPGTGTTWGSDTWGDAGWAQITGMDTDQGSVATQIDVAPSVTGQQLTGTAASAVAGASAEVGPTGQQLQTSLGNEFAGENVIIEVSSPVNDEWGTETWGAGQWGKGDGVTVIIGQETVTGDANVTVSGSQVALSLGTVEVPVVIDSGVSSTSSVGTVFAGELVEVQVTTASATSWGDAPWGEGQWGQGEGTDIGIGGEEVVVPSVDAPVTGQVATFSIGTESITGHANVTLSGQSLTISLGDEDAFTNVRINATGLSIGTIQIGDFLAGISDTASPTGVTMTPTAGTIGLNAWEIVDPGTSPTWTVVDKAA